MKILIVEDEPSLRELMSRELTREGYVVEGAASFASYRIDDVDYIETPDQAFYQIEFEKNNRPDGSLRISPTGQVL